MVAMILRFQTLWRSLQRKGTHRGCRRRASEVDVELEVSKSGHEKEPREKPTDSRHFDMSSLESPAPKLQTAGDATFLAAAPAAGKWRTGLSFLGPEGARAIQNGNGEAAETDEPPPRCPPLSAPDPANYPDDLAEKANANGLSFFHSGYSHVVFLSHTHIFSSNRAQYIRNSVSADTS